jgi:hypothetical protein
MRPNRAGAKVAGRVAVTLPPALAKPGGMPPIRLPRRRALPALAAAALLAPHAAAAQRWEALFAPRARLWDRWTMHDAGASLRLDHGAWDAFLARYRRVAADGSARIAYGAVTPADRAVLEGYLGMLAAAPVDRLSRPEQYAFWVNLYNALTLRTVLQAWPVASIRDITPAGGLFTRGPWDARLATVAGEAVTLNDIEHRILRPIWRDARTHYVLNCAALGCPDIPPRALTAANAEALLDQGARGFVNHPRGVAVLANRSGLLVSSIYVWFAADFGGEAGVVPHLLRHAAPPLAEAIRHGPRIAAHAYDWALNEAR